MEAVQTSQVEAAVEAVVFDLGGVLIDWNPRYLYRQLFDGDDEAMEAFLSEITTQEWNARQDGGRTWAEAVAELVERHPEQRDLIAAYRERWEEMLAGPIEGTVDVLRELREAGVPVYALTNWSAETFPIARQRFEFLGWFEGVVVSGEIRLVKPDPQIFHHLLERFGLDATTTLFIDDHEPNIRAAQELGMQAIRFHDPGQLRADLAEMGLLATRPTGSALA
jgi:2-haloacid dehalogenase